MNCSCSASSSAFDGVSLVLFSFNFCKHRIHRLVVYKSVGCSVSTRCTAITLSHHLKKDLVPVSSHCCPVLLRQMYSCWILVPQPGIQPASPALEGRFLTYGPPGKSQSHFIYLPFIYFCTLHTHDLFILCLEVYTFGLLSPIVPTLPPGIIFMSIAISTNRSST